MGANQSCKKEASEEEEDYIYVDYFINSTGYVQVKMNVSYIDLRYELQKLQREEDIIVNHQKPQKTLKRINPREEKQVFLHIHSDTLDNAEVGFHVTKTLEELIQERKEFTMEN